MACNREIAVFQEVTFVVYLKPYSDSSICLSEKTAQSGKHFA